MFHRVAAVHLLQELVRTALDGQMHVVDDLFAVGNGVDHGKSHILGVAGHVPDPFDAVDIVDSGDELGEIRAVLEVQAIGIDILAEKGDFLVAFSSDLLDFFDNGVDGTAHFTAPDIRHDTVRAELVAAVHDGDPGKEFLEALDRHIMESRQGHVGSHIMVGLAAPFPDELDELVDIVRTDDQIDVRRPLEELILPFLGHAARDGNDQIGVLLLQMLEFADFPQRLVFRRFADTTRIDEDDIGCIQIFRIVIAQLLQLTGIMLTVRHIRLTAIRNNMIKSIALKIHVFSPFFTKIII